MAQKREILPTCVVPSYYDLTLTPDLKTFVFYGEVTIQLKIKEETSQITFNSREIEISLASLETNVCSINQKYLRVPP